MFRKFAIRTLFKTAKTVLRSFCGGVDHGGIYGAAQGGENY